MNLGSWRGGVKQARHKVFSLKPALPFAPTPPPLPPPHRKVTAYAQKLNGVLI